MNKTLFLDRDGVINRELGRHVCSADEFEFLPGIFELASKAQQLGYLVIVITNQSGIAKGLYTRSALQEIHDKMRKGFSKRSVSLTDVYYCAHHPDFSQCFCRKPKSLLFERAIAKHSVNPKISLMLGDKPRDLIPAKRFGVKTVFITQEPQFSNEWDYAFKEPRDAVRLLDAAA